MKIGLVLTCVLVHYMADFCLTTHEMIRAKADGSELLPILKHAMVHAVLIGLALVLFGVSFKWVLLMAVFELFTHFLIDTAKGRVTFRFPLLADQNNKPYWMLFGFDQLLHLTVILLICHWSA